MKKNLEAYLRECVGKNQIDHIIRARIGNHGAVVFYIHPLGHDGETLDFVAKDNQLLDLPTAGAKKVSINGYIHELTQDWLSYEEIRKLSGQSAPTVTFRYHVEGDLHRNGTIPPNRGIDLIDGLKITAVNTGNA